MAVLIVDYDHNALLDELAVGSAGAERSPCSVPLEGQVLEEPQHSLPPHQHKGRPVELAQPTVDQLHGVPERTERVRLAIDTYVLPVARRAGFWSPRL